MIPSAWTDGLVGVLASGNGITGPDEVHANHVVLSDGVEGDYDEVTRTLTIMSLGAGTTGPAGPGYTATSSSTVAIGTGSRSFETQSGLAYVAGSRARVASAATPTNFVEGIVTSYSGTTLALTADTIGGTGTLSLWNISLAGSPGATGPTGTTGATGPAGGTGPTGATGAGYLATSATSRAVNSGAVSFTTQAGTAMALGMRVRVASREDVFDFMEGTIVEYSGTTLTIYVDRVGGSGTHADWNIVAAGDAGATGPSGASFGVFGPFGYSTGSSGSTAPGWASTSTPTTLYQVTEDRSIVEVQMPRSGTITGWSVHHGAAVTGTIEYDICINGTEQELYLPVFTMEQYGSQTALSLTFVRGDLIAIRVNPGSAAYAKIYLEITWS
jgi:hypothetical protein